MPDATFNGRKTLQPFEQAKKRLNRIFPAQSKSKTATLNEAFRPVFERQGVFSFESLPPEVRNRIYEYVFVKPTNIGERSIRDAIQCGTHLFLGDERKCTCFYLQATCWRNLSFASTCRLIHYESCEIYFASNGLTFYTVGPALHFLMAIGPRCRKLIRKLEFHIPANAEGIFDVFRYLKSCTGLRELDISWEDVGIPDIDELWEVSIQDPMQFFLGNSNKLHLTVAMLESIILEGVQSEWATTRLHCIANELFLVKREESGEYKP